MEERLALWGEADEDAETDEEMHVRSRLPERKKKKLLNRHTWERDARLVEITIALRQELGKELFEDHNVFRTSVKAALEKLGRKIGYEISFTRHFYKPEPLRTLGEIRDDILAVEKGAEGLLDGLLKAKEASHS